MKRILILLSTLCLFRAYAADNCKYCDSLYRASTSETELAAWTLFSKECLNTDTSYYASDGNKVSKKTLWAYYEIISNDRCATFYSLERYAVPGISQLKDIHFQIYKGDTTFFKDVDPQFIGENGMSNFFQQNLIYPTKAMKLGQKGIVWVQFFVEKNGTISEVTLLKGSYELLNTEAIRVISIMPPWNPGSYRNKIVRSKVKVPINFTMADEE